MTLYDLSPPITPGLAVWPGDTPVSREILLDMRRGDHLTLSTLRATVHLGAHADAPSHYGAEARTIDAMPLARYLGPARVLRVTPETARPLLPADVAGCPPEERLLLATRSTADPTRFDPTFSSLTPELIEHLHARGLRLVGVDTPSVDAFDSKQLPVHRSCLRLDVAILEGLVLDGVPEGRYELIALPLRLCGFDASPVRAVLRSLPTT